MQKVSVVYMAMINKYLLLRNPLFQDLLAKLVTATVIFKQFTTQIQCMPTNLNDYIISSKFKDKISYLDEYFLLNIRMLS